MWQPNPGAPGRCVIDDDLFDILTGRPRQSMVAKALQRRDWDVVATDLGYVSRRAAMRAFGEAYRPLVDRYGGTEAEREADRYR